jgi:hypothetical protein
MNNNKKLSLFLLSGFFEKEMIRTKKSFLFQRVSQPPENIVGHEPPVNLYILLRVEPACGKFIFSVI